MRKRIILTALTLALALSILPFFSYAAGQLPDLSDKTIYYTPDYISGDCVLSSAKTMLRRAAIARGSYKWDSITNTSIRNIATVGGNSLRHSFKYSNDGITYQFTFDHLTGTKDEKIEELRNLLMNHPEGIIVWGTNAATSGTHGILVVGWNGSELLAVDSTHNSRGVNVGIQPWSETTMRSISKCTAIWYLNSIKGGASTQTSVDEPSTLTVTGVRKPTALKEGDKFTIKGIVESNYLIKKVTVSIVDESGTAVIKKSKKPNSYSFSILKLDRDVKFGTLTAGTYTYKISATDEKKGPVTLHKSKFTVAAVETGKAITAKTTTVAEPKAPVTGTKVKTKAKVVKPLTIKGVKAPKLIRKGRDFKFKGKIRSGKRIKAVKIQIINSRGKVVKAASAKPVSRSYNIKKLNRKINFGKLKKGRYTFKVRAKDARGWKTLVKKKFKIRQ